MAHSLNSHASASSGLAWYAKGVVACTFGLIFLGGLVTSWQAGMSVPDWPLSFGSLNPVGWWADVPVRLEHGHRQFAAFVGLLTTILCALVWRNLWPLLWAAVASPLLTVLAWAAGMPPLALMHVSIWSFAATFAGSLLLTSRRDENSLFAPVRVLAFVAFLGVCLQATFGGLRVTLETAGHLQSALVLRIVHGCVAQAELCLLIAVAALLSPAWRAPELLGTGPSNSLRRHAWCATGAIYLQLILGAAMRHLGAGLAIPTFPEASASGSLLPVVHNAFIDLNFTHTRLGALVVTVLVLSLAVRLMRAQRRLPAVAHLAWFLLALVAVQVILGVTVIQHFKPRTLTTFHVVNGALLLGSTLLLALRLHRAGAANRLSPPLHVPVLPVGGSIPTAVI